MGARKLLAGATAVGALGGLAAGATPAQANRHCSVPFLVGKKFCADVIGNNFFVDQIVIKSSVGKTLKVRLVGQYPTGVKHEYFEVYVPANENKLYCERKGSLVWDYRKWPCAGWPGKAKIDVEYYENGQWNHTDFFTIEKGGIKA